MIKKFPAPQALRSRSFASRYAEGRKLATRRHESTEKRLTIIPSEKAGEFVP